MATPPNPYDQFESNPYDSFDSPPVQQQIGVAGLPQAVRETVSKFSPVAQEFIGAGSGLSDIYDRIKQLVQMGRLTPEQATRITSLRAFNEASPWARGGNIWGSIAATLPLAGGLYGGGTAVGKAVLPSVVAPTLAPTLGAATAGAGTAALTQPVMEGESSLKNIGTGAVQGVLADALLRGAGRLVQPIKPSEPVKTLLESGIVPTPGQALGGTANKVEQKLTSIPVTGDIIEAARNRPRVEFNKAELNLAMPGGQKVSQAGNAGLQEVKDELGRAYDALYAGKNVTVPGAAPAVIPNTGGKISLAEFKKSFDLGNTGRITAIPKSATNTALGQALQAAKETPTLPLNAEGVKTFDAVIKKSFLQRIPTDGVLPASSVKAEIIGDIGKAANDLIKSQGATGHDKATAEALFAARNVIQDWLNVATGAKNVAAVDTAYGNKMMIQKAIERAAAQQGLFTPYQALKASKPGTPVRALAETAQGILGNTVPNSFTTDRGLLAALLARPELALNPAVAGGAPLAGIAYSRPGARYVLGDLIPGQGSLSELLRSGAPYAAAAAGTQPDLRR